MKNSDNIQYELHHFADAFNLAFGTASYVRMLSADNEIHCSLLMARARLAPMKSVTIPRLELMAAVLAVKVDHMLKRELDIEPMKTVLWTDSTTVLQCIYCSEHRRFHTFVANRVAEIRDATSADQWQYVPTKENPTDDASRGLSVGEFVA